MAILAFDGNLFGRSLTDTSQNLSIVAATGKGIILKLGDTVGASAVEIENSVGAVVAETTSLGDAVLNKVTAVQDYFPSPGAGSVAAAQATMQAALDTLYTGINMAWNETSPQIPNGALTVFETVGQKKFSSGKLMVFVGGLKQRPTEDYSEVANKYSVSFTQPPPSGVKVEFTYIIG